MASRFWVSGTTVGGGIGNWSASSNWAATSGGAGGASVPASTDDVFFDSNGINQCVIDVAVSVNSITLASTFTGAGANDGSLDASINNQNVTIAGSFSASNKTLKLGNGTWTVSGNYTTTSSLGTFNQGNGTTVLNGVGTLALKANTNLNNLTISGTTTVNSNINGFGGTGNISGTLSISSGVTFTQFGTVCNVTSSGTITGQGTYFLPDSRGFGTSMPGTINVSTLTVSRIHTIPGDRLPPATYNAGAVTFLFDNNASEGYTFDAGSYIFTGNVNFKATNIGTKTIDLSAGTTLTIQGNVTCSTSGGGTLTFVNGNGQFQFTGTTTQAVNFNGATVQAIVVNKPSGTTQLTGAVTTSSLTIQSGTIDFNGQIITTTGALTVNAGAQVAVANLGGSTLKVNGDLTLTGTAGQLLTLNPSTQWTLTVLGAPTVTYADVSHSNASGGNTITAGRSVDSGSNTNWTIISSDIFSQLGSGGVVGSGQSALDGGLTIASFAANKVWYAPGDTVIITVALTNTSGQAGRDIASVMLHSEANDIVTLQPQAVIVDNGSTNSLTFTTTAVSFGTRAVVSLQYSNVSASTYWSASNNIFETGIGWDTGSSQTGIAAQGADETSFVTPLKQNYANLVEMLFWAPDDYSLLVSPTELWWSGQASYKEDETNTKNIISLCKSNGINVGVYVNCHPAGPYGWEFARKNPSYFLRDGGNRIDTSSGYDEQQLELWNDPTWRAGNPTTSWWNLSLDLTNANIVSYAANQIVQSAQHYGWAYARYDGHFTVTGNDTLSTTYMNTLLSTVNPFAKLGFNYGKGIGAGYTAEMQAAMNAGSMFMQEGIRTWGYGNQNLKYTSWVTYVTNELPIAKTLQGLGGYYYHIMDLTTLPNDTQAFYKLMFGLIAGAHDVYGSWAQNGSWGTPVTGCGAVSSNVPGQWGAFMTRLCGFLWAREVVSLASSASSLFTVSNASIYWQPILQQRVASTSRKFIINHLVNPPPTDVIANTSTYPAATTSFTVTYNLQAGESVTQAVLFQPEVASFATVLSTTVNGSTVQVTVPSIQRWGVLVWEIAGTFTAWTAPTPPTPPTNSGSGFGVSQPAPLTPSPTIAIWETNTTFSGYNPDAGEDLDASDQLAQTTYTGIGRSAFLGRPFIPVQPGIYKIGMRLKYNNTAPFYATFRVHNNTTDADVDIVYIYSFGGAGPFLPLPNIEMNATQNEYDYYYHNNITFNQPALIAIDLFGVFSTQTGAANPNFYQIWCDHVVVETIEKFTDSQIAIDNPISKPSGLRTPNGASPQTGLVVKGPWANTYSSFTDSRLTTAWSSSETSGLPENSDTNLQYQDFYQYDVIVLVDVDLTFSSFASRQILRDFVSDGGRLVVLGGLWTLGQGNFAGTYLDDMLPFSVVGAGEVVDQTLTIAGMGQVYSYHDIPLKTGATPFMTAGSKVLGASNAYGSGSVHALAANPMLAGTNSTDAVAFWSNGLWDATLDNIVFGSGPVTVVSPRIGIYPTITFRVNLDSSISSGTPADESSLNRDYLLSLKRVFIPDVGELAHGDEFTISGTRANHIRQTLLRFGRAANDPLNTLEVLSIQ